jgi:[CysO sulfur-carrier protein]-S-L-cysteine hydrolase
VNVELPAAALTQMIADGRRGYPNDACGLVFESPTGIRVEPIENVVDRYHAKDPERFQRTSRTAYLMDPRKQLVALEQAEAGGERLVAVYHSHADVGSYFSEEDRAQALSAGGEPLLSGVEYLVLSIRAAGCDAIKGFVFDNGAWRERSLALPEGCRRLRP